MSNIPTFVPSRCRFKFIQTSHKCQQNFAVILNSELGPSRFSNFCESSIQDSLNNRDFNPILDSWINSFSNKILQFWRIIDSRFTWKLGIFIDSRFIESWIGTALWQSDLNFLKTFDVRGGLGDRGGPGAWSSRRCHKSISRGGGTRTGQ